MSKYVIVELIDGQNMPLDLNNNNDVEIGKKLRLRKYIIKVRKPNEEELKKIIQDESDWQRFINEFGEGD